VRAWMMVLEIKDKGSWHRHKRVLGVGTRCMARVNLHNTQVILDTAHKVDEKHMFEGGA
jgi:hypothetical protein